MYNGRYWGFGAVFFGVVLLYNFCKFVYIYITVLNFDLLQKHIIFVINLTNSIDIFLKLCYNKIVINLTIILTLLKL